VHLASKSKGDARYVGTTVSPPPTALDPSPRALLRHVPTLGVHHHLIPSLGVCHHLVHDLTGGPLVDLGFLASLTTPLLPTFSTRCCRIPVWLCPEGLLIPTPDERLVPNFP
jgi:hypothetical protein